uniref:hypothetical protein n=1 Tax=Dialister sp. TaxID=1955814 RepID=UPI0040261DE9
LYSYTWKLSINLYSYALKFKNSKRDIDHLAVQKSPAHSLGLKSSRTVGHKKDNGQEYMVNGSDSFIDNRQWIDR